ncbi:MAG: hypothetical protein ACI9UN_004076 [Granulosicoccus sp.]|jgi:hypothetical protein
MTGMDWDAESRKLIMQLRYERINRKGEVESINRF